MREQCERCERQFHMLSTHRAVMLPSEGKCKNFMYWLVRANSINSLFFVSPLFFRCRVMSIVTKYPNGVWFDKFSKDYAELHSSSNDYPSDLKARLKGLQDIVQLDTLQDNCIVKLRRDPSLKSPINFGAGDDVVVSSTATTSQNATTSSSSPSSEETSADDSPLHWIKINVAHVEDPHNIFVHPEIYQVRYIQREVNTHGANGLATSSLQRIAFELGEIVGMATWDEAQGGDGCWLVLETACLFLAMAVSFREELSR